MFKVLSVIAATVAWGFLLTNTSVMAQSNNYTTLDVGQTRDQSLPAESSFLRRLKLLGEVSPQKQQFDMQREGGINLFNEAKTLHEKAQSAEDLKTAVEKYEQALRIFEAIKFDEGVGWVANNLGVFYRGRGQYDKAVDYYEKSLAIKRNLNDGREEGYTLGNLGNVYMDWGQYDKALEYYGKCLSLSRDVQDRRSEIMALNNLGAVHTRRGQYEQGVNYYEKALAIKRDLDDPRLVGYTLGNLGNVYMDWGQYDTSVKYYEESLGMCRELNDRQGEGSVLDNLGLVHAAWGQYPKAVEYYEQSLRISRELNNPLEEGRTLNNLGSVYSAWREYDKALASFQSGLEIYVKIGVPTASPKNLIGNLYMDKGEVGNAEPFIKEAGYSSSLGRLQLVKQDYQGAKEHYEKLRQSAEKSRNVDSLFTAYTGLGTAFEGLGDDKQAEGYFQKAVNLTEELRSTLPKAQRETFFDVRINGFLRTAPYDGLARVRVRMNRPIEAFKDSEYTKARVFAEAMSKWSESSSFDIPQDILTKDRELNDQLAALKKRRQEGYEKANQEIISVIEPQVQDMEQKFQTHKRMLREKYPLFAATKYPEPMALNQSALTGNEWVLAYHVTDPGIIIYLSKGKEIVKALFKPITRDNLDKLVLKFRKPLEIGPEDDFCKKLKSFDLVSGKRLSDLLLSDILNSLPPKAPLLIVPDDSLGTLPFEMLVLNDKGSIKRDKVLPYISGAKFFGDRNLISYCQSVTALTLSRIHAKAKGTEAGLLAIADPVFDEEDERMANAPKKEPPTGAMSSLFKRLHRLAGGNDAQIGGLRWPRLDLTGNLATALSDMHKRGANIYTGFDASKDNFLKNISPSINHYDQVVFATHGYFGKDLPGIMEPVLVLTLIPPGTDGYLRMTEVMGLNMNADIVALTACQTGLGKRTAGEGTMGMGRAFQYAGARSVLMSLWSVHEEASVNLFKSFFKNVKDGKSKSEALSLARNEIRQRGYDHPFFWAAFILVGETN